MCFIVSNMKNYRACTKYGVEKFNRRHKLFFELKIIMTSHKKDLPAIVELLIKKLPNWCQPSAFSVVLSRSLYPVIQLKKENNLEDICCYYSQSTVSASGKIKDKDIHQQKLLHKLSSQKWIRATNKDGLY